MSRGRHRRLAEIFRAACELDPDDREAYVARVCRNDALRAEVLELLAYDGERAHPGLSDSEESRGRLLHDAMREAGDGEQAAAPTRVGPYALEERIGVGGMGEVYAAEQLEPVRRRVAVKLIKAGMERAGRGPLRGGAAGARGDVAPQRRPGVRRRRDGGRPPLLRDGARGGGAVDRGRGDGLAGRSFPAAISANRKYVAFSSGASNLVGKDGNDTHDVFVPAPVIGASRTS